MRLISTGREALLTDDRVADAIVDYATVLAKATDADSITIPILRDDGEADVARLLLGPASQLTIVPDGDTTTVLDGVDEVVAELHRRTERYQPQPIAASEVDDIDIDQAFPGFDNY